jgi:hypothetical protein
MEIQCDFFKKILRDLVVCIKTKYFFIFYFFLFQQKPGILIPDLYLYSIKIQTNMNQNAVKNIRENHKFFEIIFEEILFYFYFFMSWAQPGPCGWAGPSRPNRSAGKTKGMLMRACVGKWK